MTAETRALSLWWGAATLVVYHVLVALLAVVFSPVILWRFTFDRRYRIGLRERTGVVPPTPADRRAVWIHGVSVGEVKAAATLIEGLRRDHPELDIVVSTTTSTGQKVARELYPDVRVIYYPLDLGWFPGRALDRIRPCCVLLMELEIWPNFLQAAARRRVPVAVINGRISASSFRGYRFVRWLLPQLRFLGLYCVQTEAYRERLLALGVSSDRIVVTGNMKYDGVLLKSAPDESSVLRDWLTRDGRQVLVCGSTHGREDEWVAAAIGRMESAAGDGVRLVTVPRHPERSTAVVDSLRAHGFRTVRWSECNAGDLPKLGNSAVVVVDTIGRLETFYGACDVAFVGGSLVPHGGQNMMEPAALGKPTLFGPHTENFRTDVELLLSADAAVQVEGIESLRPALLRLLEDRTERERIAHRAIDVIRSNQGATDRTLGLLRPLLDKRTTA